MYDIIKGLCEGWKKKFENWEEGESKNVDNISLVEGLINVFSER